MGTFNGAAFINAQMESLVAQTHPHIDVWVSDDGSTDATKAIVDSWQAQWPKGRLGLVDGPRQGFAANFRAMIVDPRVEADYYAFCDQDDIWETDKLECAIDWMQCGQPETPLLFCSRTTTMSESGAAMGFSPLFRKPPSFRNALVQSLAGGNTMVMNRAARDLLAKASARTTFVSHDWWAYLMVTGAGGIVHYHSRPLVRYRQHAANQVGANISWRARLSRLRRLFQGQFSRWIDDNLHGLEVNRDILTKDATRALDLFLTSRTGGILHRLRFLRRSGVYRQTILGTLGLYLAFVTRRM